MLAVLVSEDPRRSADRLLGKLVESHAASGGALLRVEGDRAAVFVTCGLALESFADLLARWHGNLPVLRRGRTVVGDGFVLAPVMFGEAVGAALYLEGLGDFDAEEFAVFAPALLQATRAPGVAATPTPASSVEALRQQLFAALEANEWNISRVARLMGVTRRTIYLRLRSFGITRKRVPKVLKRAPSEAR